MPPKHRNCPNLSLKNGGKLSVARGGGLTAKGRAMLARCGQHLQAPQRKGKRHNSFCARSRSWKGPRGLAARKRWHC
jgi:hypothetical protein